MTFDSEIERYKKNLKGIADWQDESAVGFLAFRRQAIFYIDDDVQDAIDFTDWPIDESAILVPDIKGRTFLGWYYDAGDGNEIPIGEYVPGANEREICFNAKFAED